MTHPPRNGPKVVVSIVLENGPVGLLFLADWPPVWTSFWVAISAEISHKIGEYLRRKVGKCRPQKIWCKDKKTAMWTHFPGH